MKDDAFMNQKVGEMSVVELERAVKIKRSLNTFVVGDLIQKTEESDLSGKYEGEITKIEGEKVWIKQPCGRWDWFNIHYLNDRNVVKVGKAPMSFATEIKFYPGRFQRLTDKGWIPVKTCHGVCNAGNAEVLNENWNHNPLTGKVYYVEFRTGCGVYKEIIKRR